MKNTNILTITSALILMLLCFNSCEEELNFYPEDKITTSVFPKNENDLKMLLNGVYSQLRTEWIYSEGGYGCYGIVDGATPNAYAPWADTPMSKLGQGILSSSDGHLVTFRWTRSYSIIHKANFLLEQIENIELAEETKSMYIGEAHFLRGYAYSVLADTYGKVPIITSSISPEESRNISQASIEETWNQAISDYNIAIEKLQTDAPEVGRATKGSALGMKMRAYLYQNKFQKVLEVIEEIENLNKYSLFPSYERLFKLENENNSEVMFDVQYMRGANGQGNRLNKVNGTGVGIVTGGTRYVPIENLVEAYEMAAEGEEADTAKHNVPSKGPYQGRDPRLYFTVVLPHTSYLGYMFPSYIYPGGAYSHPANQYKTFTSRKYFYEAPDETDIKPPIGESDVNYIVMRYADVILSKAEAIIETNGNVDEAIDLINRIRREREDVKLTQLSYGMSRDEARDKLRHERRIEFALESLYWSDIKRWHEIDGYADKIYPVEVKNHRGEILEIKFPNGYKPYYKYLPIPDQEISLNKNLEQNPGW